MLSDEFGHIEHAHLCIAPEDGCKLLIRINHALVRSVLETMSFDVDPELLGYFCTGHRTCSYNFSELRAHLLRRHKCGVWHMVVITDLTTPLGYMTLKKAQGVLALSQEGGKGGIRTLESD